MTIHEQNLSIRIVTAGVEKKGKLIIKHENVENKSGFACGTVYTVRSPKTQYIHINEKNKAKHIF